MVTRVWTCFQELVKVTCKTQFKHVEQEQQSLREQNLMTELQEAQQACQEAEDKYSKLKEKMDSLEKKFFELSESQLVAEQQA